MEITIQQLSLPFNFQAKAKLNNKNGV